jgi:prohibitin 1
MINAINTYCTSSNLACAAQLQIIPPPTLEIKMAAILQNVYKWAIPLTVAGSLAQASIYDVKGGTRAVIFDRLAGVKDEVVNEGTHFLVPWLQKSIIYDVRTKPRNISTTTGSKDLQMVSLTLRVLHRPEVQALPKIYQVCSTETVSRYIKLMRNRTLVKTTMSVFFLPSETKY